MLRLLPSRSISLAVYCMALHVLADQISCRSYVDTVYRMQAHLEKRDGLERKNPRRG